MALTSDFNALCPLFDFGNSGGVIFPFILRGPDYTYGNSILFEGTALSSVICRFKPIQDIRIISVECMAVEDDHGLFKANSATTEPIITFAYGTAPMATAEAGTTINTVTCDATGDSGKVWGPGTSTTAVTISATQEIVAYLSQTAEGGTLGTSGGQHGAALPIVWFAYVNAPA